MVPECIRLITTPCVSPSFTWIFSPSNKPSAVIFFSKKELTTPCAVLRKMQQTDDMDGYIQGQDFDGSPYLHVRLERGTNRALAAALARHQSRDTLIISFGGAGNRRWNTLLDAIQSKKNLRKMHFLHSRETPERKISPENFSKFLDAARANPSLESLHISKVTLRGDSLTAILQQTKLKEIILDRIKMEDNGRDGLAICNSFRQSVSLTSVRFDGLADWCLQGCLDGLTSSCSTIQELVVSPVNGVFSHGASASLARFITVKTSLREMRFGHLINDTDFNEESFLSIAQALMQASNLTDIAFTDCAFHDDASFRAFAQILRKPGLQSIRLWGNYDRFTSQEFASFVQPSLQSVAILSFIGVGTEALLSFLESLEDSNVERLEIGYLINDEQCRILVQSIPKFRNTKYLDVNIDEHEVDVYGDHSFQSCFLGAIRANGSLHHVTVSGSIDENILDEGEERCLQYYCARNRGLSAWISNPSTLPTSLWPHVFRKGYEIGSDQTFRALKATSDKLGKQNLSGKRKTKSIHTAVTNTP